MQAEKGIYLVASSDSAAQRALDLGCMALHCDGDGANVTGRVSGDESRSKGAGRTSMEAASLAEMGSATD